MLSDLRYLREGISFLGPDERIRCLWDHIDRLVPYLREKGLQEGVAVKVSYKDLPGEAYATEWRINPLLYEGRRHDASRPSQGSSGPLPEKVTEDPKSGEASEPPRSTRSADGYGSN